MSPRRSPRRSPQRSAWRVAGPLAAAAIALGCGRGAEEAARSPSPDTYTVRGRVVALAPRTLEVFHEAIPTFRLAHGAVSPMDAMPMPFAVEPGVSLDGVAVGDPIELTFEVHWKATPRMRATRLRELPAGTALAIPR
jgi:Cu/Ag efflux protein CusF